MTRNKTIDNAKWIVMFLVIMGHNDWGNECWKTPDLIRMLIYSFHMPACMMITGYIAFYEFSKHSDNLNYFKNVIFPYIFTVVLVSGLSFFVAGLVKSNYQPLYQGDTFMWYLYAMILFGLGLMLFRYLKLAVKPFAWIILAFLFSMSIQVYSNLTILGLNRIVAHLPFYVLGFQIAKNGFKPKYFWWTFPIFTILLIVVWFTKPFGHPMGSVNAVAPFIYNIWHYALSTALAISFLCMIPDKTLKLFGHNITDAGKHTWPVFLYHRLFYVVLAFFVATLDFSWLNRFLLQHICGVKEYASFSDIMNLAMPIAYGTLCSAISVFVCMILLTSKYFRCLASWTIKPRWIYEKI